MSVSLIESGNGWMNAVAQTSAVPSNVLILTLLQDVVDGGKLSSYATTASERSFFASHNVSTLYHPLLYPDPSGYNSGNVLIGLSLALCNLRRLIFHVLLIDVTPGQNGVILQWTRLFQPYALNFVQYRAVLNKTLAATDSDPTPYTTLPMVFPNAHTYEFLIPRLWLVDGTAYEFRLGFPFADYTFYTNSLIAKTFDVNSPFVNSVSTVSTNQSISVSWNEPEYADGIVGYRVLLYSTGTLISSMDLTLTETSVVLGCSDVTSVEACLMPVTTYLIGISVIRQTGPDSPKYVYASTLMTVVPVVLQNTSSLFLFGGDIMITFVANVPIYNNTPINETFLYPASLMNTGHDVVLDLSGSIVQSISGTIMKVIMSYTEAELLISQVFSLSIFTPMSIAFGTQPSSIILSYQCLTTMDMFAF